MVLDLRLSKDWDVEMTSFLFLPSSPLSFGAPAGLLERPSANGTPSGLLEPSGTIWNCLRPFGTEPPALRGTASGLLERAKRYWNALRALERAKRLWNGRKALAALVLFVGRRYYLRPIIPAS